MILFRLKLIAISLTLIFYSCKNNKTKDVEFSNTNDDYSSLEIEACISCFNIFLEDSFDKGAVIFDKISYSLPENIDTIFYNEIENYYSFFVKLEHESQFIYLYVDTFNVKQRGVKFYQLNSINKKLYVNQNESLVCYHNFFEDCNCNNLDSLIIKKIKPLSVINTYDTNLLGTWASDNEEIKVSFEKDYFIFDYDTIFYEKLGSYLLDKVSKDTLVTIRAISMNNLILNCDLINDGEMIYYKKTVVHPLSKK